MIFDLVKIRPEIESICRKLPVKRLGLFGSVLTDKFSPESDVDVLVAFEADEKIDYFSKYFELKEQLGRLFNREIDLVIEKPFRNPVFRAAVEKSRTVVYER
jgi:predicted nucleotidyltransferase